MHDHTCVHEKVCERLLGPQSRSLNDFLLHTDQAFLENERIQRTRFHSFFNNWSATRKKINADQLKKMKREIAGSKHVGVLMTPSSGQAVFEAWRLTAWAYRLTRALSFSIQERKKVIKVWSCLQAIWSTFNFFFLDYRKWWDRRLCPAVGEIRWWLQGPYDQPSSYDLTAGPFDLSFLFIIDEHRLHVGHLQDEGFCLAD